MGRLGTREDVATHRRYMADIVERAHDALASFAPGENTWLAMRSHLHAATAAAAAPVIEKYTGVLAAADAFTPGITLRVMQSIRVDLGYCSQVHR
jgi:hypothetical protein